MKRLLLILTLLLMVAGVSSSSANVAILTNGNAGVQPSLNCPFPTGAVDGCLAALPNQVGSTAIFMPTARQPGDWLNQLTATSTNYVTNGWPWNAPGIEYPAGEVLPVSSLADPNPATGSTLPTGCSYNATGNLSGGPIVTCTLPAANGQNYTGWNHDAINGHGCTAFQVTGGTVGDHMTISNDLIKNGSGDCAVNANAQTQFDLNDKFATITVSNVTFDGQGLVFQTSWGPNCTAPTACNPGAQAFIVDGIITFDYDTFINYWSRTMQFAVEDSSNLFTVKHSVELGCCYYDALAHGEIVEYATGVIPGQGHIHQYDLMLMPTAHDNTGQAAIPAQFVGSPAMGSFSIDHLVYIPGFSGGAQTSSITVAGHVTNATFFATTVSGGDLPQGPLVSCSDGTGSSLVFQPVYTGSTNTISAGIGGGGRALAGSTNSTWPMDYQSATVKASIDNGSGTGTPSGNVATVTDNVSMKLVVGDKIDGIAITSLGTGTGGTGTYNLASSAAVAPASLPVTPVDLFRGGWSLPSGATIPCASQVLPAVTAPFERAITDETGVLPFTQVTHTNNYVDMSVYGAGANMWIQRTGASAFTGTITAPNTLTVSGLTGLALGVNLPVIGSGVPLGTFITGGSGSTWTISPSVGSTIGPEAMNTLQTWCVNPTIFGGNVDMSGLNNSTQMNQYQATLAGNGCVATSPGTCTASQAFFTRAAANIAAAPTTFTPTIATWESAVDGLICGQVTAGTWASKDIEYFLVAPSQALAEMNLVSSNNTLTPNGTIIFDPNVGISTTHATTDFFDTGYDPANPASGQVGMTSSSGYLGICQLNNPFNSAQPVNAGGTMIGEIDPGGTTGMQLSPTGSGGSFLITQLMGTTQDKVNNLGDQGGFVISRTNGTQIQAYLNGSTIGTTPFSSTGTLVGGTTLYVLGGHVSGGTTQTTAGTLGLATAGAGETAAQVSADSAIFTAALAKMLIQSGC